MFNHNSSEVVDIEVDMEIFAKTYFHIGWEFLRWRFQIWLQIHLRWWIERQQKTLMTRSLETHLMFSRVVGLEVLVKEKAVWAHFSSRIRTQVRRRLVTSPTTRHEYPELELLGSGHPCTVCSSSDVVHTNNPVVLGLSETKASLSKCESNQCRLEYLVTLLLGVVAVLVALLCITKNN